MKISSYPILHMTVQGIDAQILEAINATWLLLPLALTEVQVSNTDTTTKLGPTGTALRTISMLLLPRVPLSVLSCARN